MLPLAHAGLSTPAVAGPGCNEWLGVSACMMPVPHSICHTAKHEYENPVDAPTVAFECGGACITFVPYERLHFGSNAHHFASEDADSITRAVALDPLQFRSSQL